ncbi:MAG: ATP-dependent Clp protease ATP-binding subunit ClpX [Lachnospiraceae bacterium]|nr:ATP-dependent Clp protease ATP-binding subunit ClpX [Lachnospiraceae bacterium]
MSDTNHYEENCQMCHRNEEHAGKMFHLPGDVCICEDCMKKTMDAMSRFGVAPLPEMTHEELQMMFDKASEYGMKTPAQDLSQDTETPKEPAEPGAPQEENGEEKKRRSPFGAFPNISFLNMGDLQGMMGGPKVKKRKPGEEKVPIIDIKEIPQPHKLKEMLDEYVVGQEHAKKVISVAVYNHYKRIAAQCMKDDEFEKRLQKVEIEKSNMLMIGPTGCGKTYLVKTLAKLLDVPLAIADATSLTEAGYIGDDIESVVSKLLTAADNDVDRAESGIIFVDEIDKIAKKKNTNSRDVSGESVQQGMLKLLEGADVEVPVGANSKNAMVPLTTINTGNILFICGGAFPDLDEIIKQRLRKQTSIGFNAELKDTLDKRKDILSEVTVEDVKKYGMIPEFVGRLPILFSMEGLTEDMLVKILTEPKNAIIRQYQKLLSLDEVDLEFTDEALLEVAKKAMEKDTGARALRSIIEDLMLDIMYEIPKDENIGKVTITAEYILGTGGPVIEMRTGKAMITDEEKDQ